jgi:excisionase family DNA binding protein
MNKFLTVKDIQDLLKISRGTVIRWIRAGQLKAFKPGDGRFWRIRQRDLKKFIK